MTVTTSKRIECPRCSAPVTGEYKFCPLCAFRLKPGAALPVDPPEPPPRLPLVMVASGAAALVVVFALLGFRIFWPEGAVAPPVRETPDESFARGPWSVQDDLLDLMVYLPTGDAYDVGDLPVTTPSPCYMLQYEVPRSMYAEFLEDCTLHPEQTPATLEGLWRPEKTDQLPYTEVYIDAWWDQAVEHLSQDGREITRPDDFHAPFPEEYGMLLAVPPSWTSMSAFEDITWEMPRDTANLPVTEVSWWEAVGFAQWASKRLGSPLGLPPEGVWIRAGHGGRVDARYPWGDEPLRYACNNLNFFGRASEPELRPVNYRYNDSAAGKTREGLWSMSGNAREWAANQILEPSPETNPKRFMIQYDEEDPPR